MTGEQLLPNEAADAPELLVFISLESTLWSLQIALIAAFPELIDDYAPRTNSPRARAARLLSDRATGLRKAINRYRKTLRAERAPPELLDQYF